MLEVEMLGIARRFGDVVANDHVDFAVEKGEIRALVGENGAGKTTLMRILFGLLRPDGGEVRLRGEVVDFHSPRDAIARRIGMVHQHFMLFDDLTVTENVVYGQEPRRWGFVDRERAQREVDELARCHGLRVDPRARVGALSVGERQRVEILKTLYRGAELLILDEPTAVLTPQERDELFHILRQVSAQGKTIVFITHKLREVFDVSHTATVMRRGRVTGNVKTSESSPQELARLMVGREVLMHVDRSAVEIGPPVLVVNDISVAGERGRLLLDHVSFKVRAGEIVGVAGVAGNGQTELVDVLVGLRAADSGHILIDGQDMTHRDIMERRRCGLAYIPEDRYRRGLAMQASVAENLALGFHRRPPIARFGLLHPREMRRWAIRLAREYDIRLSDPAEAAGNLSGGNLQKVVLARELSHAAKVILADQPTRGVDVAATEFIHRHLVERRNSGDGILLVSADLNEVMSLSDRILVMCNGRIVASVSSDDADEQELGLLMAGAFGRDPGADHPEPGFDERLSP